MTKSDRFRRLAARFLPVGLAMGGAVAMLSALSTPAAGQFFPRPYIYGGYYSGPIAAPIPRRDVGLSTAEIFEDLRDRGFRPLGVASRRPDVIVIDAIDPRRQPVRLIVDIYDGEILQRFAREADTALAPQPLNPDARKRKAEKPSPEADKLAELPAPPRRPADGSIATSPRPAPVAPARNPSEWLPPELARPQ